ncbi:betaine aldehyde dehydrogenase [Chitinispirillum alkaliphilum]|nr:betaine aldehyde dehydrogenase [Chitinispirillum alkaliphilum]
MSSLSIDQLCLYQRDFFRTGAIFSYKFRKSALQNLMNSINNYESKILRALYLDLRKSETDAFTNEVGIIYKEIKHVLKHLKKWMSPEKTAIETFLLPGSGLIYKEPYGNTLIISPWNYPFQLVIAPLIAAISGGNTALIKPSEFAPNTSGVITELISKNFDPQFLAVVNGGVEETKVLLKHPFDKIFFTGSTAVGKLVMKAAAENLTPVALELGGKSPAIVDRNAKLDTAAKKIVWGKFNNAGQTCIAPDYVLVDQSVAEEFIEKIKSTIIKFYGENPQSSNDYSRIINESHVNRLSKLIDCKKVVHGGTTDPEDKFIAPTIMTNVSLDDPVMKEEVFGPILPVLTYTTIDEAIGIIRTFTKPLALYLFTMNKKLQNRIIRQISFGGGGINTTVLHAASSYLPFGGIGHSGCGSYHGKAGFDEFTHKKSVLKQSSRLDPGLNYPGKKISLKLIRKVF